MPLLRAIEALVLVDAARFAVMGADGLEDGVSPFSVDPEPEICDGDEGWIVLVSGAPFHEAAVRFEVHSSEPEPSDEAWEAVGDTRFMTHSGRMELWAPSTGPASQPVEVGSPSTWLHARAYSRGRDSAANAVVTTERTPVGVEQWLLRVWPE